MGFINWSKANSKTVLYSWKKFIKTYNGWHSKAFILIMLESISTYICKNVGKKEFNDQDCNLSQNVLHVKQYTFVLS